VGREMLSVRSTSGTAGPLCTQVLQPRIQLAEDQKYMGKKKIASVLTGTDFSLDIRP
jgi:hypothetical protein